MRSAILTAAALATALAACGAPEEPEESGAGGEPAMGGAQPGGEQAPDQDGETGGDADEGEPMPVEPDGGIGDGAGPPETPPQQEGETAGIAHDPTIVRWTGFGPADFGATDEEVRIAWGWPLQAAGPAEGSTCYELVQEPRPEEADGVAFLFEEGGFRRYEVAIQPLIAAHVAPGDIAVGDRAEAVFEAFEDAEDGPHKYESDWRTVTIPAPDGEAEADTSLVFEIDGDGIVRNWRIGLEPQVSYVEGCG